jgi:hypothetical protein
MYRFLLALLLAIGAMPTRAAGIDIIIAPPRPPTIQAIAAGYTGFDIDGDGVREINSISLMSFEPTTMNSGNSGVAIILVDPRLINSPSATMNATMLNMLRTYRDDLVNEGYRTRFMLADVYRGVRNQDGRTLLAMRRFLKDVRAYYPSLAGVTLVGSFPEATIFRRVRFHSVENGQAYLVLHPERINPRADIVLGDLDGNWEALYQLVADNQHLKLSISSQLFLLGGRVLTSGRIVELFDVHWEDIFYVKDDYVPRVTQASVGDSVTLDIPSLEQRNPELSTADRSQPNPIARPEIMVSRLDARGIALNPSATPDRFGRTPLDANGKPQELEYTYPTGPWAFAWTNDPVLEQRILADYFDRNHAHRLAIEPFGYYRPSSIRQLNSGLPAPSSTNALMRSADPFALGAGLEFDQADLATYVRFLRTPAVLREIEAHSNDKISEFFDHDPPPNTTPVFDYAAVESQLGGSVWDWEVTNNGTIWKLTPSAKPMNGYAGWSLGRTLWENRVLLYYGQSFYLHGGCSVNVPDENDYNQAYNDPRYGSRNNADTVLFFENGLGVLARGKVFYDLPAGFGNSINFYGLRFGYAWMDAHTTDAGDAQLKPGTSGDDRVFANKRSYFWGLRGDWTIKLR